MAFNDEGIRARLGAMLITAALADFVDLTPPQAILCFLLGDTENQDLR
jgi:hypothetical protein